MIEETDKGRLRSAVQDWFGVVLLGGANASALGVYQMSRRKKKLPNQLILKIDAFTPETMPMDRLAKYIEKFAALLGNESSVHLLSVDRGSCAITAFADDPAIPKIKDRTNRINDGTAPKAAIKARSEIDD